MKEKSPDIDNDSKEKQQEIDILEIALNLWKARRNILIWAAIGAICGLIVAFSIPEEYTSTVKLAPEWGQNRYNNNLSAFAAISGLNINNSESSRDAVYPILYPEVVSSTPFTVDLFDVMLPVDKEDVDSMTLSKLILEETAVPWWVYIMRLPGKMVGSVKKIFKDKDTDSIEDGLVNPFHLTKKEAGIASIIKSRVTADLDDETYVVTISVMLQDPVAAATLADTVSSRLKNYVSDYRTEKARADLNYARQINEEAKQAYFDAQEKYANYIDRNHGLSSRSAAIEQERLQNEALLAFNLFNSTAQQVQMAEAKVQSNTPVFAVLEPASVPNRPSKPRKVLIIAAFIFLAVAGACAYVIFSPGLMDALKEKKQQLSEHNLEKAES